MIKLDGSLIAIFIIFWITFLLLKKLYFDPYRKAIEERENYLKVREERKQKALLLYEDRTKKIDKALEEVRLSILNEVNSLRAKAIEDKNRRIEEKKKVLVEERERYKKRLEKQLQESKEKIKEISQWLAKEIEKRLI